MNIIILIILHHLNTLPHMCLIKELAKRTGVALVAMNNSHQAALSMSREWVNEATRPKQTCLITSGILICEMRLLIS